MDKIKAQLTAKAGPLTVWQWAALALLALLGYWYFTKSGPFSNAGQAGTGSASQGSSGGLSDALNSSGGGIGAGPTPALQASPAGQVYSLVGQTYDPSGGATTANVSYAAAPAIIPTYATTTQLAPAAQAAPGSLRQQASVISQAGQFIASAAQGIWMPNNSPASGGLSKTGPGKAF